MVTSYKRDLNRNYLVIKNESMDYQIRMLMENPSYGFGKIKLSNWDGEESIMVDVTGLQSMDRYFSKKKIGYDELSEILYSINRMVNECIRLLLDISGLVMNPEFIFWDINEEKPVWIFYPYDNKNNDITILSEFILDHIDNSDSRVVKTSYRLYKLSKEGSIMIDELYTLLENQTSNIIEKSSSENVLRENTGKVCEAKYTSVTRDGCRVERVNRTIDYPTLEETNNTFFNKIILFIEEKWKIILGKKEKDKEKEINTSFNYSNESTIEEPEDNDETILIDISEGYVHRLISRDSSQRDEVIDTFPCIIGSKKDVVDICINDKSVSRKHAIIDLFEGTMVLSDCSKNGCRVNGIKIQKEECLIKPGDEVSFGNIKYILS